MSGGAIIMQDIPQLVQLQRAFFDSDATKEKSFRLEALHKLRAGIKRYERKLLAALQADLHKSAFEAYSTEIGIVLEEIRFTLKHLHHWMKPQKVRTPMTHIGSTGFTFAEPYGVSLIISPWNYPFQLSIAPLIGAIAAGNCAVLKPSEWTPHTTAVLADMIKELFPKEYITVVPGDAQISQALLAEKWDYIFFTGSDVVGKIVMGAAAKELTPVTLELGGKSPCIVHHDTNLPLAAKRIAWGKFMNAGQTCVAPDYLYLHDSVKDEFISCFHEAIHDLYGDKPLQNPHYTRIINMRHFERLQSFLVNMEVICGGETDKHSLMIEPTVLNNISWEDAIMKEEIFGPILPILTYSQIDDVIAEVRQHPKPLALYLFTDSQSIQEKVLRKLSFGGGCINDTIYHIASPYLPFGGVGQSGIGTYHGKASFDTFSHQKSILKQTTRFDLPFRYPNMKNGLKKLKFLLK